MRKLIQHTILFLLPILTGIVLLFVLPLNKKFAYNFVKGECNNKASWIYWRIFENTKDIDIAFSGASHTACAIMDKHINDELVTKTGKQLNVANLGYCRAGRDIQYVMLKDLFEHKKPKILVIDVTEDEPKKSHPVFPYLANTKDLFGSAVLFNQRYFQALFKGLIVRFEQLRSRIFATTVPSKNYSDNSYRPTARIASPDIMLQNKRAWERRLNKKHAHFMREFELNYSKHYLLKIAKLAKSNNCQIIFLYLPESGSKLSTPLLNDFYSKLGPVILPQRSTITNSNNWMDATHFNDSGAKEISDYLVDKLTYYLSSRE